MHYAALLKLCKAADIPVPPSGYWMKLSFGKPAEKPRLPLSETTEIAGQDDLDALMPWERDGRHNVYNRTKLYEEVWTKPVLQVAAQYGVSNTTIKKICRDLDVPVPPRGYWVKLKAGKKNKSKTFAGYRR